MENNYINSFHVTIPKYQKTVPETYTDEELAILLEKPHRDCSEVEYETWVVKSQYTNPLVISKASKSFVLDSLAKHHVYMISNE